MDFNKWFQRQRIKSRIKFKIGHFYSTFLEEYCFAKKKWDPKRDQQNIFTFEI